MRLWSLHPGYLDPRGLVALWREGLLARRVLEGRTRGYRNHPQLVRFRGMADPVATLDAYLRGVFEESLVRGYDFDGEKIGTGLFGGKMTVTAGQLAYELVHLREKLGVRDPVRCRHLAGIVLPRPHPLFVIVEGGIEPWEKVLPSMSKAPGGRMPG